MPADRAAVDVAIIGAGAAGIGAARTARELGLRFEWLEAGHRVGGRAWTEAIAEDVYLDLGCHWMHSASLNPMVEHADRLGFRYQSRRFRARMWRDGAWRPAHERDAFWDFFHAGHAAMSQAAERGEDGSVYDATPRGHAFSELFDLWVSLYTSADPDQVSLRDMVCYRDTGEDWAVRDGYGRLIAALADGLPVRLNTPVTRIRWGGDGVRVHGPRGTLAARAAVLTVSTGVLGAGHIVFEPPLPDWKASAIADLPLGCHNRIALVLDGNPFGDDHPEAVVWQREGETAMPFLLRPFGQDYVVGTTGGRFAWWLERAGARAGADLALERLVDIFGGDLRRHVSRHSVSAWGADPLTLGAYSAAKPGAFAQRAALACPLGRLRFAGEASSEEFICTAHGAYLTGVREVSALAPALGASVHRGGGATHPGR